LDEGSTDAFSQMASGFKMPDGFKFPF
jgi:hypothetical protein